MKSLRRVAPRRITFATDTTATILFDRGVGTDKREATWIDAIFLKVDFLPLLPVR